MLTERENNSQKEEENEESDDGQEIYEEEDHPFGSETRNYKGEENDGERLKDDEDMKIDHGPDAYGCRKSLRELILRKYKIIKVIG